MNSISGKTAVLAIFGDPVAHSLSPAMHNGWIADHGLDAVYVALPLRSEDPVAAFRALKQVGLKGANITVPHKEAAAAAADLSETRVANVLSWDADGAVRAYNTDGDGFLDALTEAAPDWPARVSNVLVLGAGGAAAGIVRALHAGPARDLTCIIANRTRARAEALAEKLARTSTGDWNDLESLFAEADLIVQTTTLGMNGTASPHWPVGRCRPGAIVVDIVYRPLHTPFLKLAKAQGLTAVDGLGMLIHQGARAFKLWFDIEPDTKAARRRLLAALGEHE